MKTKAMTEKLKSSIYVPVWVLTLLFPILVGLMSFTISISVKAGEQKQKIENLEKVIDSKADKTDIQYIRETLTDIKQDLKRHMDKN
jgi:5-bromo-4-chloroindolyl phosphate hydrolysis protein